MLSPEIKWLLRQARPYRFLYLVRLSTVVIASLVMQFEPLILMWLIDDIIPWRKEGMLLIAGGAFFAAHTFQFGFNSLGHILDTYTSQRLIFDLRLRLLRHLQHLCAADRNRSGADKDLLYRLENDVEQIKELGGHTIAALLRIAVMTTLTVAILLILNWKLTLVVVPLIPLMLLMRRISYPRLRKASDLAQKTGAERLRFLQHHLPALPQVQILNRMAGERRRFASLSRKALEAVVARRASELALGFTTSANFILATAIVLGFGGLQVFEGALTVGGLVAFYTYLSRVFGPIQSLATLYSSLQRASTSIRRVVEVFAIEPSIIDPPTARSLGDGSGLSVELTDVSFAYRADQPVLKGLQLSAQPGQKVALVGLSGCGKSSVANLLTRTYDIESGRLLLDGVSIQEVNLRELRAKVALVPQDPVLFDVSLRENLLYGNPRASEEDLRRALAMAQLEDTLQELPDGWDTPVGPRGERLSGGQRQRVAIARAILQDPRLLILDEATSAIDALTERRLLRSLESFVRHRTTILIAHRMSAILWADRIVVLEDGKVLDSGSHSSLHDRCGLYRELCKRTFEREDRRGAALPLVRVSEKLSSATTKVVSS